MCWLKKNKPCLCRTSFIAEISFSLLHNNSLLLVHLRLMETSSPIIPALFPFSHRHDAVRLWRQHDGWMLCLGSTSAARRKRFTTDQQSAWYRTEFIYLVEWKLQPEVRVGSKVMHILCTQGIAFTDLTYIIWIRLNRYISYKQYNIKQVVWHGIYDLLLEETQQEITQSVKLNLRALQWKQHTR